MDLLKMIQQNNRPQNDFQQFMTFAKSINGNPQQMVQNLIQSGQMSQEQFEQLGKQATEMMKNWHL